MNGAIYPATWVFDQVPQKKIQSSFRSHFKGTFLSLFMGIGCADTGDASTTIDALRSPTPIGVYLVL